MENVKVALWGFGAMGSGMAKVLLGRKGVEIIGVCDMHPERAGRSIFDILNVEKGNRMDVIVQSNIEDVLTEKGCDICICATDSFTKNAFPKLKFALEKKVNVISTAEEMSYPQAQNTELSKELDRIAKENGVSILGTGINPGLIMDLLVVCLTGCMTDVKHIEAKRVNSLSPFGPAVMEEQGVGLTVEDFNKGVESGKLAGHVGFAESVRMIGDAIGFNVDKFEQQMSPIVTKVDRKAPYGFAAAGDVAGVNMIGQGYVDGEVKIDMIHPQQIEPEMEGTYTGDYITIKGTPEVSMSIKPEVDGGLGTIAMCVNMIPHVINADPGLKTMIDLPVPRAIMGDYRDFIKR
ncbi:MULTISPECIES: 2,4-diaminopentanoate dehydrogenase [Clostridium]|uniref:NADP-binding protein n=1 Tax=Clostridium senegalense TaxID=1465809 RepID=A0A6M0H182_9CLOT|nr:MULTISPECIES: 2,4-diaminopentanoate dehydrogenase [Clostridium]NEU03631.1 NADP-binding protein [Clostridium senegalense]